MNDIVQGTPRRHRRTKAEMLQEKADVPRPEVRPSVNRPELRANEVRENDPRSAAERRAREILDHIGPNLAQEEDEFYIDPASVPDGWSYEWKAVSVLGREDDSRVREIEKTGWEPVSVSTRPDLMPKNYKGGTIEKKGMRLYMRPSLITDMVRDRDRQRATGQVAAKEAQLRGTPEGTMTRDHPKAQPNIKKSYAPIVVPDGK